MTDIFASSLGVGEAYKLLYALNSLELYPDRLYVISEPTSTEVLVISPLADLVSVNWWQHRVKAILRVIGNSLLSDKIHLISSKLDYEEFCSRFIERRDALTIRNLEVASQQLSVDQLRKAFNSNLVRLLTHHYDQYSQQNKVKLLPSNLVTALPRN